MKPVQRFTLITGATSGIGYELAKLFAREGHNLVLVARTQSDLEKVAVELQHNSEIRVIPISKNLFSITDAFNLCEDLKAREIFIDNLVNDAGQGQYGEFTKNDIHKELDIIQLNVASMVILTKFCLQEMVNKGEGRILNISSLASKMPGSRQAVYNATKAFIESFTDGVRNEIKDTGVTITTLLPGATDTDFFKKAHMVEAKQGKLASAAEVARDGYKALMNGEDIVISGTANKIHVSASHLLTDEIAAELLQNFQKPSQGQETN